METLNGQLSLFEVAAPTLCGIPLSEVDRELMRSSGFSGGNKRIYDYFKAGHAQAEKASFLKKEFGIGGHSPFGGSDYWVDHDARGLNFRINRRENDAFIPWVKIASRIDELIAQGIYKEV